MEISAEYDACMLVLCVPEVRECMKSNNMNWLHLHRYIPVAEAAAAAVAAAVAAAAAAQ